jgi:hypothetical protein
MLLFHYVGKICRQLRTNLQREIVIMLLYASLEVNATHSRPYVFKKKKPDQTKKDEHPTLDWLILPTLLSYLSCNMSG